MYIFSKMDNNIDEIINENETLKQRVNELEERLKKYTSGKKELTEVIEKRNAAYEKLKPMNYELVKEI